MLSAKKTDLAIIKKNASLAVAFFRNLCYFLSKAISSVFAVFEDTAF